MRLRKDLAAVVVLLPLASAVHADEPIRIGSRLELLVDSYLIARRSGSAALRLHHPTPREVVFVTDKPWEGNTCGYFTIFRDGGLYRMYYRGSHFETKTRKSAHREVTCYAESTDGIRWKRPELGLFEFGGSKRNNIVWDGVGTHNFTPFRDTNPACPPEAVYKALGLGAGPNGQPALYAFRSPDAIHWSLLADEPVITQGAFDSQNLAFWDPLRKQYRAYFRDFRQGRRDIRTATSSDFVHWSKPVWLAYPGAPPEHLYTNQILPYYRAPHILIGFPARFLPERGALTDGLLMTSRDGRTFHRWPEAFIRPGLNRDKWQNRSNYVWWGLVETRRESPGEPNELSIYVNEAYYSGNSTRIRRYTCRIDGFVSLHAAMSGGEMVTKPLVFSGTRLVLNFSTSAAGSVQVEIQDKDGTPVQGFRLSDCPPMFGDSIDRTVTWKNGPDLAGLAGKPIRLRFVLKDADLYALRFAKP